MEKETENIMKKHTAYLTTSVIFQMQHGRKRCINTIFPCSRSNKGQMFILTAAPRGEEDGLEGDNNIYNSWLSD